MAIKKKLPVKKAVVKKKAAVKEVSTKDLILKQSLENSKTWSTQPPGIKVNHFLAKKRAKGWIKKFNNNTAPIPKDAFMQPENFSKKIFLDLLKRPEVITLRVYFGLNEFNKVRLVFVGADAKHNDVYVKQISATPNQAAKSIIQTDAPTQSEEEGAIDFGQSCPAYTGDIVILA